jgi:hypothetical protein
VLVTTPNVPAISGRVVNAGIMVYLVPDASSSPIVSDVTADPSSDRTVRRGRSFRRSGRAAPVNEAIRSPRDSLNRPNPRPYSLRRHARNRERGNPLVPAWVPFYRDSRRGGFVRHLGYCLVVRRRRHCHNRVSTPNKWACSGSVCDVIG